MLTDARLKRLERKAAPWKLPDANGLYLFVPVTGRPRWRYDFRLDGKRKTIGLGVYPDVTLQRARERLTEARAHVSDGTDPVRARRLNRIASRASGAFRPLAEEWMKERMRGRAKATVFKKRWLLDTYILPALGRISVKDLRPSDALAIVRTIEKKGHFETARRAKQTIGEILRYGVAVEKADRDITGDLADALVPYTPAHRAALTEPREVGALLRAIDSMETIQLRSALWLLALTFVRPGELRLAKWEEFDLTAAVWRVPGHRTKQRETHKVPLSRQALQELQVLKSCCQGSVYLLPTPRSTLRPLSDAAFVAALARLGYSTQQMTPHGFRAMARTMLDEQLQEPPDVIEAQLAHVTRGALGDTYNRSRYMVKRTQMMQRWADYLDSLRCTP